MSVVDLNSMKLLDDVILDDDDLDFSATQGMRVLRDETRDRYVLSHTTTSKGQRRKF